MDAEFTDESSASGHGVRLADEPSAAPSHETTGARFSVVHSLRALAMSLWLGAAVFFSFAVAPSVFAVLPTREMAGAVVQRTLAIVNVGGFFTSLLLVATVVLARGTARRLALRVEAFALLLVAAATGVGEWVIAARMRQMREGMGAPIDALAPDAPLRVAFNALHGYSVWALTVAMLAAVVAFFLMLRRVGARGAG